MTMTYGVKEQLTTSPTEGQRAGTEGGKCAVCKKNKFELRNRKSRISGQYMFVCNTCFENKYEPRWLIILMAQQEGIASVQNFLLKKMYPGEQINAVDLIE